MRVGQSAQRKSATVLLLGAGPPDRDPNIHRPAGLFKLLDGHLTWSWKTVPQRHLNGRVMAFQQGRVLGGGSSVNARVFTRACQQTGIEAENARIVAWAAFGHDPQKLKAFFWLPATA